MLEIKKRIKKQKKKKEQKEKRKKRFLLLNFRCKITNIMYIFSYLQEYAERIGFI